MPYAKPLPRWDKTGTKPPDSKLVSGWGVDEKPPADFFNWFFNTVYQSIKELQDFSLHSERLGVSIATLVNGTVPLAQMPFSAPVDGTTAVKGLVKLNSSTASTSTTEAATPSAVKSAYDLAQQAKTSADSKAPLVGGKVPAENLPATTVYTHPATHPATMIVEDATHRFVTDSDRDAWWAKETPAGAQSKADAAKTAAAAEAIAAFKAFGLGDAAKDVTGQDLQQNFATGFYRFNRTGATLNTPPVVSGENTNMYMHVIRSGDNFQMQIAWDFNMQNQYFKVKADGTWGIWMDLTRLAKVGPLANLATTAKDTLVAAINELVTKINDINSKLADARKDPTKEFVVEVRGDDPVNPAIGRIWLRSDL